MIPVRLSNQYEFIRGIVSKETVVLRRRKKEKRMFGLSTELTTKGYHKEIQVLTFRAFALRQSESRNGPFYSCGSLTWPMNSSEAAGDLVLIQTSAFLMQIEAS